MPERNTCPECVSGKHQNCDGQAWDNDHDDLAPCWCAGEGHPGGDRDA